MRDVTNMLRTEYSETYVRTWANKLGIAELLEECLEMLR